MVTGFIVVQTIIFSYACSKPDFRKTISINPKKTKLIISAVIFCITLLAFLGVDFCGKYIVDLQVKGDDYVNIVEIIKNATVARKIVIVASFFPVVIALVAVKPVSSDIEKAILDLVSILKK
jgi:hypothetical protein